MAQTPRQMRPVFKSSLTPEQQKRAVAACPGAGLAGPARQSGDRYHPVWGNALELTQGHATDDEIRFKGATGGILTGLANFLLASGKVEFVLHVEASDAEPMRNNPRISRNREELIKGTASRYGPVAPLADISEILDLGQKFAVVAKPCDIGALRNLAKTDPRVDRLIPYMLTMICEGVPHYVSTVEIVERRGIKEQEVTKLRYRGHGWPGLTHIETTDGRVMDLSYTDTWRTDMPYELQFRCKICPDAIGLLADVATGDAWLTGAPRRQELRDGWNCIIARNDKGLALIKEAREAGYIYTKPMTFQELDAMQPQHVRRRQAILSRLTGMKLAGARTPKYTNLDLVKTAGLQGSRTFWRNMWGTFSRTRHGKMRETLQRAATATVQRTKGL